MGKEFARNPTLLSPSVPIQHWVTHFVRVIDMLEGKQERGFIHSFIHQVLIEYLLNASMFLGTGDLATNRTDKVSAPSKLMF